MDPDESVLGAILDFLHGLELFPEHQLHFNDEELFNSSDIIFHCAGASVPKGQSRLISCSESIAIAEAVYSDYKAKESAMIVVVANPVEIIASVSRKLSELPYSQVLGIGTYLDSIRMDYLIRNSMPDLQNINAVVIGEHGSTAFLSNSLSSIDGQPIESILNNRQIADLEAQMKVAKDEIKATQSATIYGVGYCAMQIFYALMGDLELKVAASTAIPDFLRKDLGEADIYLSLYSRINEHGVQPIEHHYSKNEIRSLKKSRDLIISCIPDYYLVDN